MTACAFKVIVHSMRLDRICFLLQHNDLLIIDIIVHVLLLQSHWYLGSSSTFKHSHDELEHNDICCSHTSDWKLVDKDEKIGYCIRSGHPHIP
jgi:hypothetical protein